MHALLAIVLAQACSALLPAPQAEIEWFRDGRPYARDVPVRATATERVYRRRPETGRSVERVVSCTVTRGVTYFTERTGSIAVRIPVPMQQGSTRAVGRATVRRIEAPAGASDRMLWYSVSSPGVSVYGIGRGAGVVEIRTPSPTGGVSVLRAVPRTPVVAAAPPPDSAAADTLARALAERVLELERTVSMLGDSIVRLLARPAPPPPPVSAPDIREFLAADVYVERGEYDDALAVLLRARARLRQWSDSTGARHRALDPVHDRIVQVLSRCMAGARQRRAPRCTIDAALH